eukprot:1764471-Amphidinium_carterae.2
MPSERSRQAPCEGVGHVELPDAFFVWRWGTASVEHRGCRLNHHHACHQTALFAFVESASESSECQARKSSQVLLFNASDAGMLEQTLGGESDVFWVDDWLKETFLETDVEGQQLRSVCRERRRRLIQKLVTADN